MNMDLMDKTIEFVRSDQRTRYPLAPKNTIVNTVSVDAKLLKETFHDE